ncbi:hypothetical protein JCM16106_14520 [Hydrogenophilus islandicus]
MRDWAIAETALRAASSDVVREMLRTAPSFVELEHYPPDDVMDSATSCQYYYHAHRAGEHGHFHCFVRAPLLPEKGLWQGRAGEKVGPQGDERIAQLVAISMDVWGRPQSLFLTNQWVTDETWYPAHRLIPLVDRFAVTHAYPNWAANIWLTTFIQATRPWIVALLKARDRVLAPLLTDGPAIFADRSVELLVELDLRAAWPALLAWAGVELPEVSA